MSSGSDANFIPGVSVITVFFFSFSFFFEGNTCALTNIVFIIGIRFLYRCCLFQFTSGTVSQWMSLVHE
uniref:Uncharacterized protein n=1 Tax=Anguilla anguilla TaxID=7936 RepID=A0A0E9X1A8_ANGAN